MRTTQVLALVKYAGVSPRLFDLLSSRFDDLDGLLSAKSGQLAKIDGIDAALGRRIAGARSKLDEAGQYLSALADRDIRVVTRFDADYPQLLFELNDPPPLLYVRGKFPSSELRSVALVGSTRASERGLELTSELARRFAAANVQVVSTFSKGIDSAAHLACRTAEGASFSILDSGFDNLADSDLMPLAIDIVQSGGMASEYAPEEKMSGDNMVQANRLVVGLSQAVVVTEFYHDSHRTLDLLKFCSEIGKLLFLMVNPEWGALSDEQSLQQAAEWGAIPIEGYDHIDDIINSLV